MCKKIISLLLVLAIMVQLLPAAVFADSGTKPAVYDAEQEYSVLGEEAARREESVKHFRLSDGRSAAVSYPLPGAGMSTHRNTVTSFQKPQWWTPAAALLTKK